MPNNEKNDEAKAEQDKKSEQPKSAATQRSTRVKEIEDTDLLSQAQLDQMKRWKLELERLKHQQEKVEALRQMPTRGDASDEVLVGLSNILKQYFKITPQSAHVSAQISQLKAEIDEKTRALFQKELSGKEDRKQIEQLKLSLQQLQEKQRLSHLLSRVGASAQEKLLQSSNFRKLFEQEQPHPSYVLSIDIRRSTELMLKARNPRLYAEFITELAAEMREVILQNYGIFDKFTGDGISLAPRTSDEYRYPFIGTIFRREFADYTVRREACIAKRAQSMRRPIIL